MTTDDPFLKILAKLLQIARRFETKNENKPFIKLEVSGNWIWRIGSTVETARLHGIFSLAVVSIRIAVNVGTFDSWLEFQPSIFALRGSKLRPVTSRY